MNSVETFRFTGARKAWHRRVAKLVAAPFHYLLESGQYKSIIRGRSVDKRGDVIPMLTYPAIDFLRSLEPELAKARVLEFGCGQSTKWFSKRAKSVTGLERNADFRRVLAQEFQNAPHVQIFDNSQPFHVDGRFDVILIDGEPRLEAARFATTALTDDGIIIVDNSDVQSLRDIPKLLHKAGFGRVDFFGYSPTGVRKQCTSIFTKSLRWLRAAETVNPISQNSLTEKLS